MIHTCEVHNKKICPKKQKKTENCDKGTQNEGGSAGHEAEIPMNGFLSRPIYVFRFRGSGSELEGEREAREIDTVVTGVKRAREQEGDMDESSKSAKV